MPSPKTPPGLRASGRALWRSITEDFTLSEHERSLLLQAARTADTLDDLAAAVDRDGAIVSTPTGPRTHPGLIERRQQSLTLARLLAALAVPTEGDEDLPAARAPRGVYRPRRVA